MVPGTDSTMRIGSRLDCDYAYLWGWDVCIRVGDTFTNGEDFGISCAWVVWLSSVCDSANFREIPAVARVGGTLYDRDAAGLVRCDTEF